MRYEILFSNKFKKSFSKLEFNEKKLFYKKLSLFVENHLHPSLRTKKIQGSQILFESSINMSIRVIWTFKDESLILMLDIGHHDILKRL
jgi:mRNA-degrading endonuclease YafQ of YafQ-DinJ toxin-antitoxin module